MSKIRSITYTHAKDSTIKRIVGQKVHIMRDEGTVVLTINEIVLTKERGREPFFSIWAINEAMECGLWKTVPANIVEVEYDVTDLLS